MASRIPSTMKAMALDQFGGPEVMQIKTMPVPDIGEDAILLRVEAAGVGVWDPWEREGGMAELIPGGPHFPYVPGSDGAGEVVAVGKHVTRFAPGDRAYAFGFGNAKGGLYAEYAAVPAAHAARIPEGMTTQEAAALAADGVTALRGLEHLEVQPDQMLLIVGASGGVGHIAVQLAERLGAKILAVASGPDGVELVRRLGADAAVEGHDRHAVEEACRLFAPDGFDVALVLAFDDACGAALRHLRPDGRLAYPNGVDPEPEAPEGVEVIAYDGVPDAEVLDRLNALIEAGPFHLEVEHVYRLEDAALAQRDVARHHVGKLALQIAAPGPASG